MNGSITNIHSNPRMLGLCLLFITLITPSIALVAALAAGGSANPGTSGEAFSATVLPAANLTVNTTVDEDNTGANCSLREAIVAANTDAAFGGCTAGSGSDVITLAVTGTITLTSALPDLSTSMALNGPGANLLTVSGDNNVRVFNVTVGSPGEVTLSELTIANGKTGSIGSSSSDNGAGINNSSSATVNVNSSVLSGNRVVQPGLGRGGGIANLSTGIINVTSSTLSGNSSPAGGGIFNDTGTVNVTNSTFSGNGGNGSGASSGGGIFNQSSGTVNVSNSTFSGNAVATDGGGIHNHGGGAINVTNSTLSSNSAIHAGGGIYNFGSGPVNLRNNIVALNFGPDADVSGAMTSLGHNLIGTNGSSSGFTPGVNNANRDLVGTDAAPLNPLLAPLANYGGTTQTMALLPGSPAINAGTSTGAPATDQRGISRNDIEVIDASATDQHGMSWNGIVDIGAFESRGFNISATSGTPQSTLPGTAFSAPLVATVTSAFSEPVAGGVVTFVAPASGPSGTFPGNLTTVNVTIDPSGVATTPTFTANATGGGPYNVIAFSNGVAYAAFFSLTNTRKPTTTEVTSSANPAELDTVITFTVKVTSTAPGTPTGTVQITENGHQFGPSLTLNSQGVATFTTNEAPIGSLAIKAQYSGDATFEPSFGTLAQQISCTRTTVVTNSNDSGPGSLREVVTKACPGSSTITFDMSPGKVTSPITMFGGEIVIPVNLAIEGPGANLLTIERWTDPSAAKFSIFAVPGLVRASISGLTLSNADTTQNGGAIRNFGALAVARLTLSNNHTSARGSAIYNGASLTVTACTFSGNSADSGGAIYNAGNFSITNSTLTGNTNPLTVPGSVIFNGSDNLGVVTNSTISRNTGQSVIFQNPGGVGSVIVKNSIVSGNTGGDTLGQGIIEQANNLIGGNALLAPLGDYGGPTQTMALLPGSPAIDAVTFLGDPPMDQRGFGRVGAVDIGAFESRGFTITATSGTPQSAPIATAFAGPLVSAVTSAFSEPVAGGSISFTAPASGASGRFTGNVITTNVTIDAAGIATAPVFTANGTAGGPYNVTAGGKGLAVPATFSLTNNKAATATAVASSFNPADLGQQIIFTATVTSAAGIPTGTVQFKDNGNDIVGVATLNGAGVATRSALLATAGTHTITAEYTGDANFIASSGTLAGGQIVKPQPSLSINDISITEGDAGSKTTNFTVTLSAASNLTVAVNFATGNGTATAPADYSAINSTVLSFAPGQTTGTITVTLNGDQTFEGDETFFVNLSGATNATLADAQGAATILNDDAAGGIIRFSSATYDVGEGDGFKTITVERIGDSSQAVTVDYESSDQSNPANFIPCTSPGAGFASSRCDFTTVVGTLRFAAGETLKTFNVLISQDNYVEGPETLSLTLSNPTGGAVFGVPQTATLSITDDATEPATNYVDVSSEFVRSQYHDFLNREPDAPGLAFWTDNIEKCNDPARRPPGQTAAQCIDKQRESTAVAFFMAPEFQITGGFVYHLYKGSLTGVPNYDGGSAGRFPTSLEFLRDVATVSEGIVVNNAISGAVVEANRNRLAAEFVLRPEFIAKYGGLNNTLYVQELFNTTGIAATPAQKQALVDGLTGGSETRASVLRKVVDGTVVISESMVQSTTTYGQAFINQENSRVFVFMEYVGYLRRNPDQAGYVFWLGKLNFYGGDPFQAEMVRSFILAPEYRQRFGQ